MPPSPPAPGGASLPPALPPQSGGAGCQPALSPQSGGAGCQPALSPQSGGAGCQPALPELASNYPLSPDAIARFRHDGHLLLRAVASPDEIATYRPAILAARDRYGAEVTPLAQRDSYGRAFLKGMNLWPHDEVVRRFVLARRFAKLAADLLGVAGVRVYHDQALLKEPGGGLTPWHQDQHYWPLATEYTVTLWMPLVEVTPDMGTLHFASGSHRDGYLGDLPISDASEAHFEAFIRDRGYTRTPATALHAGDATFHYGWTLHGAPANTSPRTREAMTIIWFADGTRVGPLDNANRQRDRDRWLPGLEPGDLAATDLNPLVYRAC
jgi:ectoine hydroxylase-related dioxygenase (phytanoyl-CoA dioxygenase family)